MSTHESLTGRTFGRWRVGTRAPRPGSCTTRHTYYYVVCQCGKPGVVLAQSLRKGTSTSCGCYQRELQTRLAEGRTMPVRKPTVTDRDLGVLECLAFFAHSTPSAIGRYIEGVVTGAVCYCLKKLEGMGYVARGMVGRHCWYLTAAGEDYLSEKIAQQTKN